MNYHLILDNGVIVGVSTKQVKGSTGAVFTKEYLERFGIHLPQLKDGEDDAVIRVFHPFVQYRYLEADAIIVTEEKTSEVKKVKKNIGRQDVQNTIIGGFEVVFDGVMRQYDCAIEDQLAVMQALHLSKFAMVDVKCTIDDVKKFVQHSQADCEKVMTAMSEHILKQRKAFAE